MTNDWFASYDIHGTTLTVESPSLTVGAAIDRRLSAFRCPDTASGQVRVTVRRDQPQIPQVLRTGRPVYDRDVEPVRYDDDTDQLLLQEPGQATMVIKATEGDATVWLADDSPATDWMVSHGMTTIMLIECLKRRDRFLVHAAAASHDDRAIVVPATSGGGKTTLSLALAHAGWAFMSDDMAIVEARGDTVEILGFPDELDVCMDTFRLLPWLGTAPSEPPPGYPKIPLDISRAVPDAEVSLRAAATAIVLPTIAQRAQSSLHDTDAGDALLELLPSVLLTEPESSQRQLDAFSRLCAVSKCFRLESGSQDLDQVPAMIADSL